MAAERHTDIEGRDRRKHDAGTGHPDRRRPTAGDTALLARMQRHHAASSPLLAIALCAGAWGVVLILLDRLEGNGIFYWAITVTVLAMLHVAVARMVAATGPRASLLLPATLLVCAAVLGAGMALVPLAPQDPDGRLVALVALGVAAVVALLLVLRPELLLACVALVVLPLVFTRLVGVARDGASATVLGIGAVLLLLVGLRLGTLFGRSLRNDVEQRMLLRRLEETNQALSADRMALQTESRTDPLTGLANRRYLEEILNAEWNRCRRSGAPLSCVMLDIDHFKAYNDHYGHDGGDACLRQIAKVLGDSTRRAGDVVARYGGEEFVLLLPETGEEGASTVAEYLRQAISTAAIPHASSPLSTVVTISQGIATLVPDQERVPGELVKAADLALYEAKGAGRDRIVLADGETLESARLAARGLIG